MGAERVDDAKGGTGGTVAIIDVHDTEARCAGGKRRTERGFAAPRSAVAGGRRHADDRALDQAAQNAGQCAVHTGNSHNDRKLLQRFHLLKQPPKARDTDVDELLYWNTKIGQRTQNLRRLRHVRRPCRHHGHGEEPSILGCGPIEKGRA